MPFYYNYKPAKFNRHWRAYVTYPLTPLWEFGYGLSYTEFEYSNLQINPRVIDPYDSVNIHLVVKNAGDMAGKEVVQLYIDDVISSVVTPIIELKGLEKISLEPGEQKSVSFQLTPYDISLLNMSMERVVEAGTFDVMVGRSCKDIRLQGSFEVVEKGLIKNR
jgi:beta-glucosidase